MARTRPRKRVSILIGQRDDRIIIRSMHVHLCVRHLSRYALFLLFLGRRLCHTYFFATVRLPEPAVLRVFPRTVRLFVFVR